MSGNIIFIPLSIGDPDWATIINTNFQAIIRHNHGIFPNTGQFVSLEQVSCVSDIDPYSTNSDNLLITDLIYIEFDNLTVDLFQRNTIYVKNGDLYYSNQTKFPVQITNNGSLNIHIIGGGGFTGGLSAHGASVTYASIPDTYTFLGNAGSGCTLNIGVLNVTNLTDIDLNSFNTISYNTINFSNIAASPAGSYILFSQLTFNTLQTFNINLIANTPTLAQSSINQVNFLPVIVGGAVAYNIFAYSFQVIMTVLTTNVPQYAYFNLNHGFMSGQNAYLIQNSNPILKGNSLVFSIYDRDGTNFPPTCSIPADGSGLKVAFSSTYNKSLFTPLVMVNLMGAS